MKSLLFALLLLPTALLAQATCPTGSTCITIPSQVFNVPVTINGTVVQVSVTVPAQAVPLPATSSSLPTGMAYSAANGLQVTGPITATGQLTATQVSLTGGPAVPTCSSGLYLLQYTASTNMLTPACYTPTSIPPITVSQAASGAITLTP